MLSDYSISDFKKLYIQSKAQDRAQLTKKLEKARNVRRYSFFVQTIPMWLYLDMVKELSYLSCTILHIH
jgi:hypothetical protein